MAIILFLLLSILISGTSAVSIMPELKQNVLRFGYGVNFRYEGMLAHSFDRFYVVTVTVLTQLPTHSFGTLQNQPKHRSLSNPLENQSALG